MLPPTRLEKFTAEWCTQRRPLGNTATGTKQCQDETTESKECTIYVVQRDQVFVTIALGVEPSLLYLSATLRIQKLSEYIKRSRQFQKKN